MLKFTYIKIGVGKMFKKHIIFYAVMLSCVAISEAGVLPASMEFGTKLNLFATQASVPDNLLAKYQESYLQFDINFNYHVNRNLFLNFLPYARASYDVNRQDKIQAEAKIWQVYLNYKIANFDFNFGRFDFAKDSLAPFIYYGDNLTKDLSLPTALDGIKHNFRSKYLDYILLFAKEAQIGDKTKAKLAGAEITVKPLSWLNLSGFYFYRNKKYPQGVNKIDSKLSVYGVGIDLFFSDTSGFRVYGAQNGGEEKRIRPFVTQENPYKGYAFNGEFYFQNAYKTGTLKNKIGLYVFSDKEKFYTFPNKLQTSIIYGGMDYKNILPASPQIVYAALDYNFKKYSFLCLGFGVFVYSSGKENLNNRNYYAKEININTGVKFDTWGFNLSGGLFGGEALFLGGTTTEKQKIKKLQANFFYKFTL